MNRNASQTKDFSYGGLVIISSYTGYRWHLFIHEIKHWLTQLSGMSLFLVLVLGTSAPALFYLALVGFGMLAEKTQAVPESLLLMVCILLLQTAILDVCKNAITGRRFIEFNRSLGVKSWPSVGFDCLLAMMCNPMVVINLWLLCSVDGVYWANMQHMLLFLLVQLVLTLLIFLSPIKTYLTITCCFLLSYVPFVTSIELGLFYFLIVAFVLFFIPTAAFSFQFSHYSVCFFWFDFWLANNRVPLLVFALSLVTFLVACGFEAQRPDLAKTIFLVAGQFLVLVVSALQIELNKLVANHRHFFSLYQEQVPFCRARDQLMLTAGLPIFVVLGIISVCPLLTTLQFLLLLCCFWVSSHRPKHLLYAWLLSCVFVTLVQRFLMVH